MSRVHVIVVVVVATLSLAGVAGAVPSCSQVATFQACNAYCGMFGSSCFQMEYDQDPFGNDCSYRYECYSGHTVGWGPCNCGGGGGCMVPGTEITLADSSSKVVEEIQVGDRVLSFDEATGAMSSDEVSAVHDPVEWSYHLVINSELRLTPSHRVLSDGRWVQAAEIRPGDPLTRADGSTVTVDTLEVVEAPITVHNFATSPNHTFVASGFVVHNKPPIPREEPPDNPNGD